MVSPEFYLYYQSEQIGTKKQPYPIDDGIKKIDDNLVVFLPSECQNPFFNIEEKGDSFSVRRSLLGKEFDILKIHIDPPAGVISNIPDLWLLVNPSSLEWSKEHLHNPYYTRTGPKIERGGLAFTTLTFSGSSGGFYNSSGKNNPAGYNISHVTNTLSFKNIMSLVTFYKCNGIFRSTMGSKTSSNGSVYRVNKVKTSSIDVAKGTPFVNSTYVNRKASSHEVLGVGKVKIYYRDTLFEGSFTSMSLTFNDTSNSKVEFNFSFNSFIETKI